MKCRLCGATLRPTTNATRVLNVPTVEYVWSCNDCGADTYSEMQVGIVFRNLSEVSRRSFIKEDYPRYDL